MLGAAPLLAWLALPALAAGLLRRSGPRRWAWVAAAIGAGLGAWSAGLALAPPAAVAPRPAGLDTYYVVAGPQRLLAVMAVAYLVLAGLLRIVAGLAGPRMSWWPALLLGLFHAGAGLTLRPSLIDWPRLLPGAGAPERFRRMMAVDLIGWQLMQGAILATVATLLALGLGALRSRLRPSPGR